MCGGAVGGLWCWGSWVCQPHAPHVTLGWMVRVGHEEQLVELRAVFPTAPEQPLGSAVRGKWEHSHVLIAQEVMWGHHLHGGVGDSNGKVERLSRNLL